MERGFGKTSRELKRRRKFMKKALVILLMAIVAVSLFVGCKKEPKVKTYTVTFDSNGGTAVEAKTVNAGDKISGVTAPTKGGCEFAGWTKDGKDFNLETDIVTGNMTLVAKWNYKTFALGDTGPAGGKIFYAADEVQTSTYLDADGNEVTYTWKYLEVSTEDLKVTEGGTETSEFIFGEYKKSGTKSVIVSENTTGLEGNNAAIGQGRYNTSAIVNAFGATASDGYDNKIYAAKVCADYETEVDGVTYDDWFLPSLKELDTIFAQKSKIGGTWNTFYFSSSENDAGNAWYEVMESITYPNGFGFTAGEKYGGLRGRNGVCHVRAIRAF